jgi:hypothetical protein
MGSRTKVSPFLEIDGASVRRRRIERRLKVAELAKLISIHPAYLYNLELGYRRRVRVETMRRFEEQLGPGLEAPVEPVEPSA